jgi:hypothetical protein
MATRRWVPERRETSEGPGSMRASRFRVFPATRQSLERLGGWSDGTDSQESGNGKWSGCRKGAMGTAEGVEGGWGVMAMNRSDDQRMGIDDCDGLTAPGLSAMTQWGRTVQEGEEGAGGLGCGIANEQVPQCRGEGPVRCYKAFL